MIVGSTGNRTVSNPNLRNLLSTNDAGARPFLRSSQPATLNPREGGGRKLVSVLATLREADPANKVESKMPDTVRRDIFEDVHCAGELRIVLNLTEQVFRAA